jgi:hypothetical protein
MLVPALSTLCELRKCIHGEPILSEFSHDSFISNATDNYIDRAWKIACRCTPVIMFSCLSRRVGDCDDDVRRPRSRRSPGPIPVPVPSGGSIGDRRPKIRPLVCAATPEDLIAARGLALLRLTLIASGGAEEILARDVGLPPWDLPSLEILSATVSDSPRKTSGHSVAGSEQDRGSGPDMKTGQDDICSGSPAGGSAVEIFNHVTDLVPSTAKSSTLEFRAELWVRGSQRPEPFLDRLLSGGFTLLYNDQLVCM